VYVRACAQSPPIFSDEHSALAGRLMGGDWRRIGALRWRVLFSAIVVTEPEESFHRACRMPVSGERLPAARRRQADPLNHAANQCKQVRQPWRLPARSGEMHERAAAETQTHPSEASWPSGLAPKAEDTHSLRSIKGAGTGQKWWRPCFFCWSRREAEIEFALRQACAVGRCIGSLF
jgi:hypothetical protein